MKRILALALTLSIFSIYSPLVRADVLVGVDTSASWLGFMNVNELPINGGGFVFNGTWGTQDLVAKFTGDVLTLAPNSVNDPSPFWYQPSGGPGSTGNKITDANFYVEIPTNTVNGQTLTFSGTVLTNTLTSAHVAKVFIRDFAPDYSSHVPTEIVLTPGPFSISLATDPGLGRHVQYGFNFNGPCVWITDVAPFGTVTVQGFTPEPENPGDFDEDGDVDGRDFLLWQRGDSPGNGSAADLAEWQNAYGTGTGPLTAVTAVPEPASLSLIAGLASLLVIRRSR